MAIETYSGRLFGRDGQRDSALQSIGGDELFDCSSEPASIWILLI